MNSGGQTFVQFYRGPFGGGPLFSAMSPVCLARVQPVPPAFVTGNISDRYVGVVGNRADFAPPRPSFACPLLVSLGDPATGGGGTDSVNSPPPPAGLGGGRDPRWPKRVPAAEFESVDIQPIEVSKGETKVGIVLQYKLNLLPVDSVIADEIAEIISVVFVNMRENRMSVAKIILDASHLERDLTLDEAKMVLKPLAARALDYREDIEYIGVEIHLSSGRNIRSAVHPRRPLAEVRTDVPPAPSPSVVSPGPPLPAERGAAEEVKIEVSLSSGDPTAVECKLPVEAIAIDTSVYFLAQAVMMAFAKCPMMRRLIVDFSLSDIKLEHPLARTWPLVEDLPADVFPEQREVEILLRISREVEILYAMFRGQGGLRKTYVGPGNKRWEVLEIRNDPARPYDLFVRNIDDDPTRVEVHVDVEIFRVAGQVLKAVIADAMSVIGKRQGLKKIVWVIPELDRSFMLRPLSEITADTHAGYVGPVAYQLVGDTGVTGFNFMRGEGGNVSWDGRIGRIQAVERPPKLYQPMLRPSVVPPPLSEVPPTLADPEKPKPRKGPPESPTKRQRSFGDLLRTPLKDLFGGGKPPKPGHQT